MLLKPKPTFQKPTIRKKLLKTSSLINSIELYHRVLILVGQQAYVITKQENKLQVPSLSIRFRVF